jgi:hypothetical protein
MSDVMVVSCRLCLRAEESDAMVGLDLPPNGPLGHGLVLICRPCARAIAGKIREIDFEEVGNAKPVAGTNA